MTVPTRDAWSDATTAATQAVLEPELAAVRRRLWWRRALVLTLECVAFLAAYALLQHVVGLGDDDLRLPRRGSTWAGVGLIGLGLVLVLVSALRTAGASRPFVAPADFLPRADLAWLRARIAGARAVPEGRQVVVVDAARRMVVEGRYALSYLGLASSYVGMTVATSSAAFLIAFSALIVWLLVRTVREAAWSRRARRWLARNA